MFIQQAILEYPEHMAEISSLNFILAEIQKNGTQPHLQAAIDHILARLDQLMIDQYRLKQYNQFEVHR